MNARLLLLLLLWLPMPCLAQMPADTRFDNLGIEAGLSQSTVHAILQDHQGYIWICTEDGLNRYDGYRFKIFRNEPGNSRSIANSQVFTTYEDRLHHLWTISGNGICRYHPADESFARILFQPGIIKGSSRLKLAERGNELFFTDAGILYRINVHTEKVQQQRISANTRSCYLLAVMPDSSFLMRDAGRLYAYDPATSASKELALPRIGDAGFEPRGAVCLPGNRLILYGGNRLVICNAVTGALVKTVSFEERALIPQVMFDSRGYLWLGSINGAICLDTATMQYRIFMPRTADANSLTGSFVRCFYKDRTGILWIGTNEGGISRVNPAKSKFSGMSERHDGGPGLTAKAVLRFGEDQDGNIWMATNASGLNIYNPARQTVTLCDKSTGCPFHTESYILSLMVDDTSVWCGHDGGIDVVSLRTHKIVASPLRKADIAVKEIYKDNEGNIWAGGHEALLRYNARTRIFEPYRLPVPILYVQDIIEDLRGDMWIGLDPGLIRLNTVTGNVTNYALKYPELIGGNSMSGFSIDSAGTLWMGSSERGLTRYDETADSFISLGTAAGLPNSTIYATIVDNRNDVWVTTNYGVSRFSPTQKRFTSFTVKDGLQSNEFIGRAIFKDHAGRLYFGNIAGFNSIDPEHISNNTIPPRPQITAFRVFDDEIPFRQGLEAKGRIELAQSQNYFSIEYSALDYTISSENKYRIMLDGFDKDWRPLSTAHSVSYTNLDPGHYTFRVMAYNNDGVASAQALDLPIYVRPPFYKTWWFLSLVALTIIGLVLHFMRMRMENMNRKAAARLQLSDLDRKMTEYKLQALQAQMNPHFIFNSLNAIQSIIMQNDALKAATYLADFSKLMRRILDNSHEQFVSLETIVETLKMYVHLEEFRFNNEFSYEFRVDEDLPMKGMKLPPMLLQPYVENAILHGLMPKEGSKNLLIHLFEKDEHLHCVIEDNGVGRGNSSGEKKKGHISRGEVLTKGIRESLNQLLNITATITYHDLKDAAGEPAGTRVAIIIPLP